MSNKLPQTLLDAQQCRPTLRCVGELVNGWHNTHERQMALGGHLDPPPFARLSHPIIEKAREMSASYVADGNAETISSANFTLFKVKRGDWRGAVWVDPETGQPWLVAGGQRRGGDRSDFYEQLSRIGDQAQMLPTAADREALRIEIQRQRLAEWERSVAASALKALVLAAEAGSASFEVSDFTTDEALAACTIRLERSEPPRLFEDEAEAPAGLTVELDWSGWREHDEVTVAVNIISEIVNPRSDEWDVLVLGNGRRVIFTIISEAEIEAVRFFADSTAAGQGRPIGPMQPGRFAHVVPEDSIAPSVAIGTAVRAICGQHFVVTRPADGIPVCTACAVVDRFRGRLG